MTLIATLIPAYKADYLCDLFAGLRSQTFKDFRVILSDDSPGARITEMIRGGRFDALIKNLNLLVVRGRKRWGVEFKLTAQPAVTRSMTIAIEDLRLRQLFVVHAGTDTFPMAPGISAVALSRIAEDLRLE